MMTEVNDEGRTIQQEPLSSDDPNEEEALFRPVEFITEALILGKERFMERREELIEALGSTVIEIKPRLRGWVHLCSVPVTLIAGLTLLVGAPTVNARIGAAIFIFTALLLFSISATYHRTNGWLSRRWTVRLNKTDHISILFLIAGSVTPFSLLLLEGNTRLWLLIPMWTLTLIAAAIKTFFPLPHRYVSVAIYIALGWIPVLFLPAFYKGALEYGHTLGLSVFLLIVIGGALYTIGGIIFGLRPQWTNNFWPGAFEFHEWFHALTVLAFFSHYAAVSLLVYSI